MNEASVAIRALTGGSISLTASLDDTLANLRAKLAGTKFASCKLFYKGIAVGDSRTVGSLNLASNDFLTAMPVKKVATTKVAGATASTTNTAVACTPVIGSAVMPSLPRTQTRQESGQAVPIASSSNEARHNLHALASTLSPAASPASSPAQSPLLDSLLPGYFSRPNPSPNKSRHTVAPQRAAHPPALSTIVEHDLARLSAPQQDIITELNAVGFKLAPIATSPAVIGSRHVVLPVQHTQHPQKQGEQHSNVAPVLDLTGDHDPIHTVNVDHVNPAAAVPCASGAARPGFATSPAAKQQPRMLADDSVLAELRKELAEVATLTSPNASAGSVQQDMTFAPLKVATAQHPASTSVGPTRNPTTCIVAPDIDVSAADNQPLAARKRRRAVVPPKVDGSRPPKPTSAVGPEQQATSASLSKAVMRRSGRGIAKARLAQPVSGTDCSSEGAADEDSDTVNATAPAPKRQRKARQQSQKSQSVADAAQDAAAAHGEAAPRVSALDGGVEATSSQPAETPAKAKPERPPRTSGVSSRRRPARPSDASGGLNAAKVRLPLPPPLVRLEAIFVALSTVYNFQLSHHMQATWDNTHAALQSALPHIDVQLGDLALLAELVPVVQLRGWLQAHEAAAAHQRMQDARQQRLQSQQQHPGPTTQHPLPAVQNHQPLLGTLTADADGNLTAGAPLKPTTGISVMAAGQMPSCVNDGGFMEGAVLAQGWSQSVAKQAVTASVAVARRDATAVAVAAATTQSGDEQAGAGGGELSMVDSGVGNSLSLRKAESRRGRVVIIELVDPGRSVLLPTLDMLYPAPAEEAAAVAIATAAGKAAAVEADDIVEPPAKRAKKARSNVQSRRIAAVRLAFVDAVLAVHADFLMQLSPPLVVPPTEAPVVSAVTAETAVAVGKAVSTLPAAPSAPPAPAPLATADLPQEAVPVSSQHLQTKLDAVAVNTEPNTKADAPTPPSNPTLQPNSQPPAAATAHLPLTLEPPPLYDPIEEGKWHSSFDLSSVTLGAIRQAAAGCRRSQALLHNTAVAASSRDKVDKLSAILPTTGAPRPPTLLKCHAPCTSLAQLDTRTLLQHLQHLEWYDGQVVHIEKLPPRDATYATPLSLLHPLVHRALLSRGVQPNCLFTHQAKAIDALIGGQHTVIATSTASGKSLCYLVPILQALCMDRDACALLMFPTKALAQDQRRSLQLLIDAAFGGGLDAPSVDVYDGDTPQSDRPAIRERVQLLITNPDMLHMGILPAHSDFARFLGRLRYVVIDEGHAYKGVFGSHTALVLRRLRRLCSHLHHNLPRFVVTSATIANPQAHAQTLTGVAPITLVDVDGSPHGPKSFVLWNPPLTDVPPPPPSQPAAECSDSDNEDPAGTTAGQQIASGSAAVGAAAGAIAGGIELLPSAAYRESMRLQGGGETAYKVPSRRLKMTRTEARKAARPSLRAERSIMRQQLRDLNQAAPRTRAMVPGVGTSLQQMSVGLAVRQQRAQLRAALFGSPNQAAAATAALAGGLGRMAAAGMPQHLTSSGAAVVNSDSEHGMDQASAVAGINIELDSVGPAVNDAAPVTVVEPSKFVKEEVPSCEQPSSTLGGNVTQPAKEQASAVAQDPATAKRQAQILADARAAISRVTDGKLPSAQRSVQSLQATRPLKMLEPAPLLAHLLGLKQQQQKQQQAAAASGPAAGRKVLAPPGESTVTGAAGGGVGNTSAAAVLRAEVVARLPGRDWKERYGAAGTPGDARRESPIVEIALLLAECVQHGLRTIAFCKSRKLCELVAAYCREVLRGTAPELMHAVAVYRGGYSPVERRRLEADLHSGNLRGVAATNALELGIDVGALDVTLHLGFPGSVSSLRQQAGRAGRREQASLSLYCGFDGPLDQHFMRHPADLFGRANECAQVDPSNLELLQQHLCCAACELPICPEADARFFGPNLAHACTSLQASSLLGRHPRSMAGASAALMRTLHWIGPKPRPAADVSLRMIDPERFAIINELDGTVMESIEASTAFYEVYDGAVYMYQGRPYLCRTLDLSAKVALVRPADVKYYTKLRDYTDVHVTGGRVAYPTSTLMPLLEGTTATPSQPATMTSAALQTVKHEEPTSEQKLDVLNQPQEARPCSDGGQPAEHNLHASRGVASVAGNALAGSSSVRRSEKDLSGVAAPQGGTGLAHTCDSSCGCGSVQDPPFTSAVAESALVTVRFLGFFRIMQGSNHTIDAVDLYLPDVSFATQAAYVRLPRSAGEECAARGLSLREGCHAANHALLSVLPLYLPVNTGDVRTECDNPYDTRYRIERLLIFDAQRGGGLGIAAAAAPRFTLLLQRALRLVSECPCTAERGCPSCVQHMSCANYNAVISKAAAEVVLRHVLAREAAMAGKSGGGPVPVGWLPSAVPALS